VKPLHPFSTFTYYRRNKRRVLPVLLIIALLVVGINAVVEVVASFADTAYQYNDSLQCLSMIIPRTALTVEPSLIAQVKSHPYVAMAIPTNGFSIYVDLLVGQEYFSVLGLKEQDIPEVLQRCQVQVKEGRLLRPSSNEVMLSEAIVRARGLHLGDKIGNPVNERDAMPTEFVLVGILDGQVNLGAVSYEFLASHELYAPRREIWLVFPEQGEKEAMDRFLEQTIASQQTRLWDHNALQRQLTASFQNMYLIIAILDVIIVSVVTVAIVLLNYIYFMQRLDEFGTLYALGFSRRTLVARVFREVAVSAVVAGGAGVILSWACFLWLQVNVYAPRGFELNVFSFRPLLYTIPVPVAVIVGSVVPITWVLAHFDPVTIIERR